MLTVLDEGFGSFPQVSLPTLSYPNPQRQFTSECKKGVARILKGRMCELLAEGKACYKYRVAVSTAVAHARG